ncbi:MAG: 30S ribosomal protein S8e [Candidatus Thorarchaeota archaeon SMTZ-45]|nr:MAG: 30S ribosomal protein S8e [Candidatus Thorarchaeota archaeon SMTZ1-45]KXH75024.1 MAG: 30S ribosomal protein S8e [Candidatus Thorarchaeota archaeon SMTZ-45]
MGVWHRRSSRTSTGARLRRFRGKRKHQMGRTPTETLMGEAKRISIDSRSKAKKTPALRLTQVNVTDPSKNVTYRAELQDVEKNPANMDYQRRKVITRGTIIKTSKGRARVTSRPGQDGILNAVLI